MKRKTLCESAELLPYTQALQGYTKHNGETILNTITGTSAFLKCLISVPTWCILYCILVYILFHICSAFLPSLEPACTHTFL